MLKLGFCGALVFGPALAVGGLLFMGCQPAVPASPSYEANVLPIFMSHCVRCHGGGGTLNQATEPTGPDAAPLVSDPLAVINCYLNQYESTDCATTDGGLSPACHHGAYFWATAGAPLLKGKLHGQLFPPMPPPPAPALDDWELKVVDAWLTNPVCSNAASPNPTICPADSGVGQ